MSLLDWIPTIEETIDFIVCRATGHSWVKLKDGRVICEACRKIRK